MKRIPWLMAGMILLGTVVAAAQIEKGKYQNIEVMRFETKEGVNFPPDWQVALTDALVKQVTDIKKFGQVLREGETAQKADALALRLTGVVTEYKPGSRAKRYMLPGAGATKIKAHIKVLDRSSSAVLFEDDVDGKVVMGVVGGESMGAANGLAKEVATKLRQRFF